MAEQIRPLIFLRKQESHPMKNLIYILLSLICFSCKEDKNFVKGFKTNQKTLVLKDSIFGKKGFNQNKIFKKGELFKDYFISNKLDSLYVISNLISPNNFQADFNGDGKEDIVFFVRNVMNNKGGLIFFHSQKDFFVVGGGNEHSALENLYYTKFTIDNSKIAYETVIDSLSGDIVEPNEIKLKNIALHMKEEEGTSGLLTWDGEKYIYIHTGD